MAKDNSPATTSAPAPVMHEDGRIDPSAFIDARAEAQIESGYVPYLTEEEKDEIVRKGTPVYILGVRWKTSDKFRTKDTGEWRRNCELSVATDVNVPRTHGIWGGLPDTPYWQHFEPKITSLLDFAEAQGNPRPFIGPLYPHQRMYQNEYGEFASFDFRDAPQITTTSSGVANGAITTGEAEDDTLPFD